MTSALVAYATKHGSTAEIAETIGETFRARGMTTEVAPAEAVQTIDGYDLVVVGAGVYIGRWHSAAVGFLKRFERGLRDRPVWLFGSGPTGGTPKAEQLLVEILTQQPPAPGNVAKLAARIGVREYRTFGGRAGPGMAGIFERWVPKGDWRDFDAVGEWADRVADSIQPVAATG